MIKGMNQTGAKTVQPYVNLDSNKAMEAAEKRSSITGALKNLVKSFEGNPAALGTLAHAVTSSASGKVSENFGKVLKDLVAKGTHNEDGTSTNPDNKLNDMKAARVVVKTLTPIIQSEQKEAAGLKKQQAASANSVEKASVATAGQAQQVVQVALNTTSGSPKYEQAFTDLVNVMRGGGEGADTVVRMMKDLLPIASSDVIKMNSLMNPTKTAESKGGSSSDHYNYSLDLKQAITHLQHTQKNSTGPMSKLNVLENDTAISQAASFHQDSRAMGKVGKFPPNEVPIDTKTKQPEKPDEHSNATPGRGTLGARVEHYAERNAPFEGNIGKEVISKNGKNAFTAVLQLSRSPQHYPAIMSPKATGISVASKPDSGFVVAVTSRS